MDNLAPMVVSRGVCCNDALDSVLHPASRSDEMS